MESSFKRYEKWKAAQNSSLILEIVSLVIESQKATLGTQSANQRSSSEYIRLLVNSAPEPPPICVTRKLQREKEGRKRRKGLVLVVGGIGSMGGGKGPRRGWIWYILDRIVFFWDYIFWVLLN